MTKIETSTFLVQAIITEIKNRIETPVSPKDLHALFKNLSSAQKMCKNERMAEQIVSLYGKVVDAFNKHIEQEISALKQIKDVSLLQKKIKSLEQYPGISKTNLTTLSFFKQSQGKVKKIPGQFLPIQEIPPEEIEEVITEIFELSTFIYYEEHEKTKKALNKISTLAQNRLLKHLSCLRAPLLKDKLSTLQALFATAYELAEKPSSKYPTPQEIKTFFEEKEEILKEEQGAPSFTRLFLRHA